MSFTGHGAEIYKANLNIMNLYGMKVSGHPNQYTII